MATRKRKPKYKLGALVYSYQNRDYKAPVNRIHDNGEGYAFSYRLSLKGPDKYKVNSNWIDENSLFRTLQNPGFFSKASEAGARRVKRVHLVREIYTGEIGELVTQKPALLKQGWVKVKWRNRDKPTLIQKSEIVPVKASARTKAVDSDPTLQEKRRRNPSQGGAGAGATSSDVRSPTRTEVRSPTKTSTVAHTRGNITVTGGAGAGATTSVKVIQRGRKKNPLKSGAPVTKKYIVHVFNPILNSYSKHGDYNNLEEAKDRAHSEIRNARAGVRSEVRDNNTWKVVYSVAANPSVNALAETFQGRASGATADFKAADSAPVNLARIGKLVFLKLRDVRAQISAPGAMVAVDTRGKLWLVGQGNMFSPKAKAKGEALDYGEVDRICYLTAKQHIGNGKQTEYVHTFGEDGGKRPRLLIDHDGMPILRGGDYQIRAEGIVN